MFGTVPIPAGRLYHPTHSPAGYSDAMDAMEKARRDEQEYILRF